MGKIILTTDLCDTLIKGNTTFIFLDSFLLKNKRYLFYKKIKSNLLIRIFFKICYLMKIDLNRRISLRFIKNTPKYILTSHLDKIFNDKFIFNQEILSLILLAKQKDNDVYIASASLDFIVEYISKKLGIKFISTSLIYKNEIFTGKINRDLLFLKEKFFIQTIKTPNIGDKKIIFISDNKEDEKLLKTVDYGFVIFNKKNTRFFEKKNITPFNSRLIKEILDNE